VLIIGNIYKSELSYKFSWYYKDDKKKDDIILGSLTTKHECFRIWDTPKSPWNKPWIKALDFAIVTCGANGIDTKKALANITTYLHSSYGLAYDTKNGESKYMLDELNGYFELTKYMIKYRKNVVNCYDQAGAVTTLGRVIGLDVNYLFMEPFGYIKTTTLVGGYICNNPFFKNSRFSPEYIIVGLKDSNNRPRASLGNHAFVEHNSRIFDACVGSIKGTSNRTNYVDNVIDSRSSRPGNPANIQLGNVTGIQ
jgi:hypothetical protein